MSADEQDKKAKAELLRKSPSKAIVIEMKPGDDPDQKQAEAIIGPFLTNAVAFGASTKGTVGELDPNKVIKALVDSAKRISGNDFGDVEAMLASQAVVLNGMFADLAQRAALNRAEGYFDAAQIYLKMAFKAQNQARMTLETLSAIKYPPVVYARQANIATGLQQVNNGTAITAHAEKSKSSPNKLLEACNERPLDPGAAGASVQNYPKVEAMEKVKRSKNA